MTVMQEEPSSTEIPIRRYVLAQDPERLVRRPPPGEILAEPLRKLLRTLLLSVVGGIALLFCAGFKPRGFGLPDAVLIAIVAGISAQYRVSAVPALSSGIANIVRAYYEYEYRSKSTTTSGR